MLAVYQNGTISIVRNICIHELSKPVVRLDLLSKMLGLDMVAHDCRLAASVGAAVAALGHGFQQPPHASLTGDLQEFKGGTAAEVAR